MKNLLGAAAPLLQERYAAPRRALDFVQAGALALLLLLVLLCATACSSAQGVSEPVPADSAAPAAQDDAAAAGDQRQEPDVAGASADETDADAKAAAKAAASDDQATSASDNPEAPATSSAKEPAATPEAPDPDALFEALDITEDYRKSFVHGEKPAEYQRYIVLHDTEGGDSAANVIDWWDSNGNLVAAHFIVNKDGSIWQCVPLDKIAHHAGFGDTGHNVEFGINNEARDDKKGTTPIGEDFADYGMNSYSVGIEMVHQGGEGDYPKAQLEAVDGLIAYIDAYYGFESQIIDHKAWRSGNSDTSKEFAKYLKSYQQKRTHK